MNRFLSMIGIGQGALLTRYLLGELPDARRSRLEASLLADEALYERLLMAEDDLIDAYLRGALPEGRRLRFEARFFATEESRARVDLARAFLAKADAAAQAARSQTEATDSPWWVVADRRWAGRPFAVATLTILLIFGGWLWLSQLVLDGGPELIQSAVAIALYPPVRSDGAVVPRLELAADDSEVELKIYVEAKGLYQGFRVRLETSQGEALWGPETVEAGAGPSTVSFSLPTKFLRSKAGDTRGVLHVLKMDGQRENARFDRLDEYEFRVIRIP